MRRETLVGYIRSLLQDQKTRFPSPFVVSAVGGGGKTTILVNLFQQKLRCRSILTTTTAMIAPGHHDGTTNPCKQFRQLDEALLHISPTPPDASGVWYAKPFPGVPGKYSGVDVDVFDGYIREQREEKDRNLIVFCEADGSKRKPLKAHAEHEPVIPRTTDLTLIVLGCSCIGKPLTEQFVHRASILSEIIGKEQGELITFDDLISLLCSQHLLKGIPRTSRVAVVFNQADLLPESPSRQSKLRQWAEEVLAIPSIDAVFFTRGAGDAHKTEYGIVRTNTGSPLFSAVVLAAGLSTRMGENNKLLLPLGDKTILEHTLSHVLKSNIRELIVVLGHEAPEVNQAVAAATETKTPATTQVKTVLNERYKSGQGTSVACGVSHLSEQSVGCFFVPGDQPFVSPAVMRTLAESSEKGKIIIPSIAGKCTSPVLFDRVFYEELANLNDEKGGRKVIDEHKEDSIVLPVECRDRRAAIDVDTQDDYDDISRRRMNGNDGLPESNKKWKLRFFIKVFLFFLICIPLFATVWALLTYDNVSFNEITFHLHMPIKGTGGGLALEGVLASLIPSIAATLVFAFLLYPNRHKRKQFRVTSRHHFRRRVWIARFLVVIVITTLVFLVQSNFNLAGYVRSQVTYSTFMESHYVDPNDVGLKAPEKKRNLIFIFLESMESTYADIESGGSMAKSRIPHLTELAKQHISFSHHNKPIGGFRNSVGTSWTTGAAFGAFTGMPLCVPVAQHKHLNQDAFFPGIISLGDIFEKDGYRNVMMASGDTDFGGQGQLFMAHGNYDILDYTWAHETGRIPKDYFTFWGFEDYLLYDFAREQLTSLSQSDQPFTFTLFTLDTHFEDGVLCPKCRDDFDEQYSRVIACADRQICEFVEWLQQQDFYENTTIIIVGDHLTMSKGFSRGIAREDRAVYNCIINSVVEAKSTKNREFMILDLFPTTLASMGYTFEGSRLGLGTNLFSDDQTFCELMGTEEFDEQLTLRSTFYEHELLQDSHLSE